jgi:hypothetical protein
VVQSTIRRSAAAAEYEAYPVCGTCEAEPATAVAAATLPQCGTPAPHKCKVNNFTCKDEACIARRVKQRQKDVRTLGKNPAAVQLAELLRDAEHIASELRGWLAEHGPGHRCPLCNYLRRNGEDWNGPDHWFEDLLVLAANLGTNTSILMNSLPSVIYYELIRDQYEPEE